MPVKQKKHAKADEQVHVILSRYEIIEQHKHLYFNIITQ